MYRIDAATFATGSSVVDVLTRNRQRIKYGLEEAAEVLRFGAHTETATGDAAATRPASWTHGAHTAGDHTSPTR